MSLKGLDEVLKGVPDSFFQKKGFNPWKEDRDRKDTLQKWLKQVDTAVEQIVDIYHKGFNTSTTSLGHILNDFSDAQQRVKELQDNMVESRRMLGVRNNDLKDLWMKNIVYKKVLEILDKIDYVKDVPAQLDDFIKKKQHLHAVTLLQHTLHLLGDEDLREVVGLLELREELLTKRNTIQSQLLEELHRLIYLKDFHRSRNPGPSGGRPRSGTQQGGIEENDESVEISNHSRSRLEDDDELLLSISKTSLSFKQKRSNNSSDRLSWRSASFRGSFRTASRMPEDPGSPLETKSRLSVRAGVAVGVDLNTSLRGDDFHTSMETPRKSSFLSRFSPFAVPASPQGPSSLEPAKLRFEELMAEEAQADPQRDPRKYMQMIIEAVDQMNHLPSLQSQLRQTAKLELKQVIEQERLLLLETNSKMRQSMPLATSLRYGRSGLGIRSLGKKSQLLVDLMDRIFNMLTRILKNVIDVAAMIEQRISEKDAKEDKSKSPSRKTGMGSNPFGSPRISERDMMGPDETKFSVQGVWELMQIQLQIQFCDFLQVRMETKVTLPKRIATQAPKGQTELSFSFDDSLIPSIVKMSHGPKLRHDPQSQSRSEDDVEESEQREKETPQSRAINQALQPSPYNIILIYRPIVEFTDQCLAMSGIDARTRAESVSTRKESDAQVDSCQLREFVKVFISSSFLPRVEADVNLRLKDILADPYAFSARELHRDHLAGDFGEDSYLLLKSAMDIFDLVQIVFKDMLQLPSAVLELTKIIQHIVNRFLDKCHEKYQELTNNVYAAIRLTDPKVVKIFQNDPLYRMFRDQKEQKESFITDFFAEEKNRILYGDLLTARDKEDGIFKKYQSVFDPKSLSMLSLLSESLEWLSHEIVQLFDPSASSGPTDTRTRYPGEIPLSSLISPSKSRGPDLGTSQRSSFKQQQHDRRSFRMRDLRNFSDTKATGTKLNLLDATRYALANACQLLADRCLFCLRYELHCHFFYFLGNMQTGSYWCASDPTEPEPFVLELNKDLTVMDDAMSKYFGLDTMRYIFGGAGQLMTAILIHSLSTLQDKRVNKKGVAKICRNLFALQQNLTNIIASQEAHFDRARQYFELLNLPEDDLHQFEIENKGHFSEQEYAELLQVRTTHRPTLISRS